MGDGSVGMGVDLSQDISDGLAQTAKDLASVPLRKAEKVLESVQQVADHNVAGAKLNAQRDVAQLSNWMHGPEFELFFPPSPDSRVHAVLDRNWADLGRITVKATLQPQRDFVDGSLSANQLVQAGWGMAGAVLDSAQADSAEGAADAQTSFRQHRQDMSDATRQMVELRMMGMGARVGSHAQPVGQGFSSFYYLKKHLGPAGPGRAWHHVVEQTPANIARFGAEAVHNTANVVNLTHGRGTVHSKISGFYSSKQRFSQGLTVRQWRADQSFDEQVAFGLDTLERFGGVQ